ncbi:MAG: hypothetical protein ACREBU_17395, partial [Nitrososphaera sp.]
MLHFPPARLRSFWFSLFHARLREKAAALKPDGSAPKLTNEVVWNVRAKWKFGRDNQTVQTFRFDRIRGEGLLHASGVWSDEDKQTVDESGNS